MAGKVHTEVIGQPGRAADDVLPFTRAAKTSPPCVGRQGGVGSPVPRAQAITSNSDIADYSST